MDCRGEPGGSNADESGGCPAATEERFDGINRGKNAGRFCWAVAGTFCRTALKGTFVDNVENCLECSFYLEVQGQEGRSLVITEKSIETDDLD